MTRVSCAGSLELRREVPRKSVYLPIPPRTRHSICALQQAGPDPVQRKVAVMLLKVRCSAEADYKFLQCNRQKSANKRHSPSTKNPAWAKRSGEIGYPSFKLDQGQ